MPVKSLHGRELGFDSQTGELVVNGARSSVGGPLPRARGRDYYVSSTTGAASTSTGGASGKSYREASSTLAGALNKVTAGQGDRIIILEGHVETLSSATALTLSKAGIEIIGLGRGAARPTFTLDTATDATINVTAARVTIRNCIFSANFADIVSFFTLTAAKRFILDNCRFQATATNMNALYVVDTNATSEDAAGLTIQNCEWVEPDLATVGWIKMDGTNDDVKFNDNYSNLGVNNNKSLITVATGKVVTNLQMLRNRTIRLNTDSATGALLFHTDGSTNSGMVADNYTQHADTAAELIVTASSGLSLFQNYSSGVNGNSGYVIATIDT
jgi:hypothetical protein